MTRNSGMESRSPVCSPISAGTTRGSRDAHKYPFIAGGRSGHARRAGFTRRPDERGRRAGPDIAQPAGEPFQCRGHALPPAAAPAGRAEADGASSTAPCRARCRELISPPTSIRTGPPSTGRGSPRTGSSSRPSRSPRGPTTGTRTPWATWRARRRPGSRSSLTPSPSPTATAAAAAPPPRPTTCSAPSAPAAAPRRSCWTSSTTPTAPSAIGSARRPWSRGSCSSMPPCRPGPAGSPSSTRHRSGGNAAPGAAPRSGRPRCGCPITGPIRARRGRLAQVGVLAVLQLGHSTRDRLRRGRRPRPARPRSAPAARSWQSAHPSRQFRRPASRAGGPRRRALAGLHRDRPSARPVHHGHRAGHRPAGQDGDLPGYRARSRQRQDRLGRLRLDCA